MSSTSLSHPQKIIDRIIVVIENIRFMSSPFDNYFTLSESMSVPMKKTFNHLFYLFFDIRLYRKLEVLYVILNNLNLFLKIGHSIIDNTDCFSFEFSAVKRGVLGFRLKCLYVDDPFFVGIEYRKVGFFSFFYHYRR